MDWLNRLQRIFVTFLLYFYEIFPDFLHSFMWLLYKNQLRCSNFAYLASFMHSKIIFTISHYHISMQQFFMWVMRIQPVQNMPFYLISLWRLSWKIWKIDAINLINQQGMLIYILLISKSFQNRFRQFS